MTDENKGYRRRFILAGGVVIFAIGQSLLFIIVAPIARTIGLSVQQFGLAFTIANITLLFAAPYWGRKSDVIGRKPVFIIGLFGSAFGTLLMALTLEVGLAGVLSTGWLFVMIVFSRAAYGITASAIYPSAAAYIADVTNWQQRAKGMALIGSANSLGSILGPMLGGGLAFLGVLVPMYTAAAISLIGAFAAILWLVEPERHREQKKDAPTSKLKPTDPRLRPYMIMWASFFVFFISLNFVTAFYIEDKFGITDTPTVMRTASIALLCMAAVITVLQGLVLQIIHVSPQVLLRLCGPAFSAGLFTMAFAPSLFVLFIGFGLLGVAFACANPGISGSASMKMKPHEQGAAAGYLSAANTLGAILGPVLGTSLYKIQPNAPMLLGGTLFIGISIYAFFIPAPRKDPQDE
jgi:MFS family permease